MLNENLKDAADVLKNILSQPLSIPGASENVSLLSAAQDFNPAYASQSDLSKILFSFLKYPEATENLIKELQILSKELEA